jgi:hypothetical protein
MMEGERNHEPVAFAMPVNRRRLDKRRHFGSGQVLSVFAPISRVRLASEIARGGKTGTTSGLIGEFALCTTRSFWLILTPLGFGLPVKWLRKPKVSGPQNVAVFRAL